MFMAQAEIKKMKTPDGRYSGKKIEVNGLHLVTLKCWLQHT